MAEQGHTAKASVKATHEAIVYRDDGTIKAQSVTTLDIANMQALARMMHKDGLITDEELQKALNTEEDNGK